MKGIRASRSLCGMQTPFQISSLRWRHKEGESTHSLSDCVSVFPSNGVKIASSTLLNHTNPASNTIREHNMGPNATMTLMWHSSLFGRNGIFEGTRRVRIGVQFSLCRQALFSNHVNPFPVFSLLRWLTSRNETSFRAPRRISVCARAIGAEDIGRWDETEHQLFLEGLQKYGNDWKKIANMVCPPLCVYAQISTRNLVQVRTHAQKYFQKINKNVGS